MRTYECVYILDPSLEETAVTEKTSRFNEIITSRNGTVEKIDIWGKRRLAYPIAKKFEGIYILMKFHGNSEILTELDRIYRFDDAVLRHLITVDDNPPPVDVEAAADEVRE